MNQELIDNPINYLKMSEEKKTESEPLELIQAEPV